MIESNKKGFLTGAVLLILALGLATVMEHQKEWKRLQRRYYHSTGQEKYELSIKKIVPGLTGKPELCLSCHLGIEEISSSHPIEAFGCVVCHGGDGRFVDKKAAHQNLIGGKNPADLRVVTKGCGGRGDLAGSCHNNRSGTEANQIDRVKKSLQASYAGGIVAIRFGFGADTTRVARYGVANVQDDSILSDTGIPRLAAYLLTDSTMPSFHQKSFPAMQIDSLFRGSCLSENGCHHWTAGKKQAYFYRSTGCSACHYLYSPDGKYEGRDVAVSHRESGHGLRHRLTTAIPYWQCNHCHNRGTYHLRKMEFLPRDDLSNAVFSGEAEERANTYYQPISQYAVCEIKLDCIDCHSYRDVMGDDDIHFRKMDVVEVRCRTCHGTLQKHPQSQVITDENDFLFTLAMTNPNLSLQSGEKLVLSEHAKPLLNVREENGDIVVISKVNGRRYPAPPVKGSKCKQKEDEQEAHFCHTCHDINPHH